jgi:hypothetical protein
MMFVVMMPLARACTVASGAATAQRDCCKHKADACCDGRSKVCCATQAPADNSLLPSQDVSRLVLPPLTIAVEYTDSGDSLHVRFASTRLPAEHSPPGLMIVATTILRI